MIINELYGSLEIEKLCLGCVLTDPHDWTEKLLTSCQVEHFDNYLSKQIYNIIKECYSRGILVDNKILIDKIESNVELNVFALECCKKVGLVTIRFNDYIKILIENKIKRDIRNIGLIAQNIDINDIKSSIKLLTDKIQKLQPAEKIDKMAELTNIVEEYNGLKKRGDEMNSSFPAFDKLVNGFKRGRLYVLGGFPGTGKTGLALFIAQHIAFHNNRKVLFFSLEMSSFDIFGRLASLLVGIPSTHIQQPWLMTPEDLTKMTKVCGFLYKTNFCLYDGEWTVPTIITKIREEKPDMVIIDHLQYLPVKSNEREKTHEAINTAVKTLRDLAKKESFCLFILSQMSKGGMSSEPDFKNSAGIREQADLGMVIKVPDRKKKSIFEKPYGYLQLNIIKNRHGKMGFIPLILNPDTLHYSEYAEFGANEI
jgi:replicative DNA helicase